MSGSSSSERTAQIQVHQESRHNPTKRPNPSSQNPSLTFVMYSPLLLVQHRLLDCWLRLAGSADLDFSIRRSRRLVGVDAGRGWLRCVCDATRRRRRFGSSSSRTVRCRDRFLRRCSSRSHYRLLRWWRTRSPSRGSGYGSRKSFGIVLGCRGRQSFLARPGSAQRFRTLRSDLLGGSCGRCRLH
jgi:hypothetical protein